MVRIVKMVTNSNNGDGSSSDLSGMRCAHFSLQVDYVENGLPTPAYSEVPLTWEPSKLNNSPGSVGGCHGTQASNTCEVVGHALEGRAYHDGSATWDAWKPVAMCGATPLKLKETLGLTGCNVTALETHGALDGDTKYEFRHQAFCALDDLSTGFGPAVTVRTDVAPDPNKDRAGAPTDVTAVLGGKDRSVVISWNAANPPSGNCAFKSWRVKVVIGAPPPGPPMPSADPDPTIDPADSGVDVLESCMGITSRQATTCLGLGLPITDELGETYAFAVMEVCESREASSSVSGMSNIVKPDSLPGREVLLSSKRTLRPSWEHHMPSWSIVALQLICWRWLSLATLVALTTCERIRRCSCQRFAGAPVCGLSFRWASSQFW